MKEVATAMAKLAGIRKAVFAALNENTGRAGAIRLPESFPPEAVGHYFTGAERELTILQRLLPNLYGDFQRLASAHDHSAPAFWRQQMEQLVRDIDQMFEIRANSELEQPAQTSDQRNRVFLTHGRSSDWREVQSYIEKDIKLGTLELAQEPNLGMTVIEKLFDGAEQCDSAVIVMTGDDTDSLGQARSRENVMHEIGFFQGRYGRSKVCLLHEEGVNIPTNLSGIVYIPYPKGTVSAGFHVLARELHAIYQRP